MSKVQIDEELFLNILKLMCLDWESDDLKEKVEAGLEKKLNDIMKRKKYQEYIREHDPQEKEKAKQEYLKQKGVIE